MKLIFFVTLFACAFISNSHAKQSQCKGLKKSDCIDKNSCSWVAAYERKDGKKVNAFCRVQSKAKS